MGFWGETWQWWLNHGFDGIGAGVVGVVGVAITLWFDRRRRREELAHAQHAEIKAAVRRVMTVALEAKAKLRGTPTNEVIDREFERVETALRVENHLLAANAPMLYSRFNWWVLTLKVATTIKAKETHLLGKHARKVMTVMADECNDWLSDPVAYAAAAPDDKKLERGDEMSRELGEFTFSKTTVHPGTVIQQPPPTESSEDPEDRRP